MHEGSTLGTYRYEHIENNAHNIQAEIKPDSTRTQTIYDQQ